MTVVIPECGTTVIQIQPGAAGSVSCPFGQGFGGPVTVTSDFPVLASQRVQYFQSFNEVAAMPSSSAATELFMPWYDHASSLGFLADNVHVINPTGASENVTVTIPGCDFAQTGTTGVATLSVAAGGYEIFSCVFGSGFGGPVVITTTGGGVLASQRVQYFQTFNEAAAAP